MESCTCNLPRKTYLNICWNSRCNCRSFFSTEMFWMCFDSSSVTVDDIRFKSQEKYKKLSLNFISVRSLSHKIFQSSLYLSIMFELARCMPCPFFCSPREVIGKVFLQYYTSMKITLADNQQKFDSCTNSALYMLNDWR